MAWQEACQPHPPAAGSHRSSSIWVGSLKVRKEPTSSARRSTRYLDANCPHPLHCGCLLRWNFWDPPWWLCNFSASNRRKILSIGLSPSFCWSARTFNALTKLWHSPCDAAYVINPSSSIGPAFANSSAFSFPSVTNLSIFVIFSFSSFVRGAFHMCHFH